MLYSILIYNLDLMCFALAALGVSGFAEFVVLRRHPDPVPRRAIAICAFVLGIVGILGAHRVGETQRDRLRFSIEGVAPIYACAMEQMGHSRIQDARQSDDPDYQAIIDQQKRWLKSYPAISDIYTMRKKANNTVEIIVDSETDYDGNGVFDSQREQRTSIGEEYPNATKAIYRALQGESVFDDVPVTDRWGTSVSAYSPLRSADGTVEAIVGVDFVADNWIRTLLLSRGCVLAITFAFLIGIVVLISVSHLQRAEIETQRRFGEQLQEQKRQVEEALRKLKSYEFVLDSHAILCVTDENGIIVHANQKFAELCGCSPKELLGRPYHALEDQDVASVVWEDILRTVDQGDVWHGEICSRARDGSVNWVDTTVVPYHDTTQRVTQRIAMGTDVTAKKQYEAELVKLARLDRLTGLPNRGLFFERLERAIQISQHRPDWKYAVLFLDFDRFKAVNDTYGHNAGDELLQGIAYRLREVVACDMSVDLEVTGHTAARLGGDEFVVLLTGISGMDEVLEVTSDLLQTFEVPHVIMGNSIQSTASIGIVMSGQAEATPELVLRDADEAMYLAKQRGRSCYAIFNATTQAAFEVELGEELGAPSVGIS